MATCTSLSDDPAEGLVVVREDENELLVPFGQNISLSCEQPGKPLRNRATANFRYTGLTKLAHRLVLKKVIDDNFFTLTAMMSAIL